MGGGPAPHGRVDVGFWRDRRVLLTGHTGFKGGWLAVWLARLGAEVTGVALPPDTSPSFFEAAGVGRLVARSVLADVRDASTLAAVVREAQPEVLLHLAAQPLVRRSYRKPLETFATNVMGTAHVLDALRDCADVRVAVMVTTDKVYANREWVHPYRESDPLGGHDPYSASKAASEIVIDSYRRAFLSEQGVAVASARAGNVIGGGDWSEDRLLPDAVRAWQRGEALDVRRPDAVRPWQHVLEPLAGYLVLAQHLWRDANAADAYNFGPSAEDAATVRDVIVRAQIAWPDGGQVAWGDGTGGPHEAGLLALDPSKARALLGVCGRWRTGEAVDRSIRWYARQAAGESALALCHADIDAYEACLVDRAQL
jgi:CDP-glucose 4,6-dehydratase